MKYIKNITMRWPVCMRIKAIWFNDLMKNMVPKDIGFKIWVLYWQVSGSNSERVRIAFGYEKKKTIKWITLNA